MKRAIVILLLIVLLAAAWYGYKAYTGKVESLMQVAAEQKVSATDLMLAFERDSAAANKMYLGKVIEVSGNVKAVEKEASAATVVLGEAGTMKSVRCSMDTTEISKVAAIAEGAAITVKGVCTGFISEELLGADVILNRCVLVNK